MGDKGKRDKGKREEHKKNEINDQSGYSLSDCTDIEK
jgi:hypothetical protein